MTALISWRNQGQIASQIQALRSGQRGLAGIRAAVVYGGLSAEDRLYISRSPVEQMSITAVTRALAGLGVPAVVLDPCERSFLRSLLDFEVIVPALHGPYGEDGRLQGMLDYLRRPYCGSGVAASAVAADKALCKLAMAGLGVATPPWHLADAAAAAFASQFAHVMVKPRLGGSSVGMSLVSAGQGLDDAISVATAVDPVGALIEEFVPGLPVTVGLLELPAGVLMLPPLAVQPRGNTLYDAETKLDSAGARNVSYSRANLAAPIRRQLKEQSLKLWHGIGCHGIARIDFIVAETGLFALEVNTVPGLSYESNFALAAYEAGLGHSDIVLALLLEAVHRSNQDVPLPVVSVADLGTAQPAERARR
jgi:D-alanine-D-alanine ligase